MTKQSQVFVFAVMNYLAPRLLHLTENDRNDSQSLERKRENRANAQFLMGGKCCVCMFKAPNSYMVWFLLLSK